MGLGLIPARSKGEIVSQQQMRGNIVLVESQRLGQRGAGFVVQISVRLTSVGSHNNASQFQVRWHIGRILANCAFESGYAFCKLFLAFLLGTSLDYGFPV